MTGIQALQARLPPSLDCSRRARCCRERQPVCGHSADHRLHDRARLGSGLGTRTTPRPPARRGCHRRATRVELRHTLGVQEAGIAERPRAFVAAPRAGDSQAPFGYWSALLGLLIYSFGWARPDRGLRWWYDAGKPPTTRACSSSRSCGMPRPAGLVRWVAVDDAAHLRDRRTGRAHRLPRRWHPGSDRRSLGRENSDRGGRFTDRRSTRPRRVGRTAPLIAQQRSVAGGPAPAEAPCQLHDRAKGDDACRLNGRLVPRPGALWGLAPGGRDRTWRVDVVVRPVGYLGTFRRSRTTGLWFSGRHRHHVPDT